MTWLFTSTTYGTWLPGDPRGSVTSTRDRRPEDPSGSTRIEHSRFGTPFEPFRPGLYKSARAKLKCPPIRLTHEHAELVLDQFRETCRYRGWRLAAVAIMWNHFHAVAWIGDDSADRALRDLKAYSSRRLNRRFGKPASGTWWTQGGSKRPLFDDAAIAASFEYVLDRQSNPLVIWSALEESGG